MGISAEQTHTPGRTDDPHQTRERDETRRVLLQTHDVKVGQGVALPKLETDLPTEGTVASLPIKRLEEIFRAAVEIAGERERKEEKGRHAEALAAIEREMPPLGDQSADLSAERALELLRPLGVQPRDLSAAIAKVTRPDQLVAQVMEEKDAAVEKVLARADKEGIDREWLKREGKNYRSGRVEDLDQLLATQVRLSQLGSDENIREALRKLLNSGDLVNASLEIEYPYEDYREGWYSRAYLDYPYENSGGGCSRIYGRRECAAEDLSIGKMFSIPGESIFSKIANCCRILYRDRPASQLTRFRTAPAEDPSLPPVWLEYREKMASVGIKADLVQELRADGRKYCFFPYNHRIRLTLDPARFAKS